MIEFNKIKNFFFLFLLVTQIISSSEWMTEVRGSYFFPTSKRFRETYDSDGLGGEIELSKKLACNWMVWGNINYIKKSGHTIDDQKAKTKIMLIPITIGLRYHFTEYNCYLPYLGVGVGYTIANVKNHFGSINRRFFQTSPGFVIKSGTYFEISNHLLLDLFIDYYFQKMDLYSLKIKNIGGFRTGLGFGYRF